MSEPNLVFVGTSESLAARIFRDSEELPSWFEEAARDEDNNAQLTVEPWGDDRVLLHLTVWIRGDQHVVKARVSAMYRDVDITNYSDVDKDKFARSRTEQLMPFVRQAVHSASGQVWPVAPILIDIRPGRTVVSERAVRQ